ncbi:MAG: hypothetical protein ABL986_14365 [Vicinamibacterales bacterium]
MGDTRLPGPQLTDQRVGSPRTPGALGHHDAADPDQKQCRMGDSPGTAGLNDFGEAAPSRRPTTVRMLVLDPRRLDRLFRSVALAKAMAQHTRVEWQEYNDSPVLNFIYWAMPWKGKPGWAEVTSGSPERIDAEADKEALRLADVLFGQKARQGAVATLKYLEHLAGERESALQDVKRVYADARDINSEVIEATTECIKNLTRIKASSELFLAPASLAAGPVGAAIWLAYEIDVAIVTKWDQGMGATVVAVGKETGEEMVEKVGEKASDAAEQRILAGGNQAERVKQLRALAAKYAQQMAGKKAGKAARLASRQGARLADIARIQKLVSAEARVVAGKMLGRLNVLFVAKDAAEAWGDLTGTFD